MSTDPTALANAIKTDMLSGGTGATAGAALDGFCVAIAAPIATAIDAGGGGGGATLPIDLTTGVSGILPVANGGTGAGTAPAGGFAGLTALASGDAASVSTAAADATTKANAAQAAAISAAATAAAAAIVSERSATATETNKTIDAGSNTLTGIVNACIASGAAIALSKIVNPTGTGLVKATSGVIDSATSLLVNADVSASAAIAASKLAPSASNADVLVTANGAAAWSANQLRLSALAAQLTPSEASGNFTTGVQFTVTGACNCVGVRFYVTATSGSKSYKVSLWNAAGTRVTNATIVCATTGVYEATFAAQALLPGALYKVSIYETTGAKYQRCPLTTVNGVMPARACYAGGKLVYETITYEIAGDNHPTTQDSSDAYMVEPMLDA